MQLSAWLKRHEGRPGVAQGAMAEQVLDVAVTGSRSAEAEAYEVRLVFLLCAAETDDYSQVFC